MDSKDWSVFLAIQVGILMAFSVIYVGLTISAFWFLGEFVPGVDVSVEGFLEEYAAPFFLAAIVIQLFNRFTHYLMNMN